MNDIIARAAVTIDAPAARVWDALTNPDVIKQYMFGTNVVSDWREGSPIVWQGEWQGRKIRGQGNNSEAGARTDQVGIPKVSLYPSRILRTQRFDRTWRIIIR